MNENECGLFTDFSSIIKNTVLNLSGTAAGNLGNCKNTDPALGNPGHVLNAGADSFLRFRKNF